MIKLSYSRHDIYQKSPRAYYLQYIAKLVPDMYKGAFILGDCFDAAIMGLLEHKNVDLAIVDFRKRFSKYQTYLGKLDVMTSNKIHWTKTEGCPNDWYMIKAPMAIEAFATQALPHIAEVHGTQVYTKIEGNDGSLIRGYADMIVTWKQDPNADNYNPELDKWNDKKILFDLKLSTQKYDIPTSQQLATYSQSPNVIDVDAQGYIVVPKAFRKKKEPLVPVKITIDKVTEDTIESVFAGYQATLDGIKMGKFPCNREACAKNPFGCAYKKYCDSNGEDLTGLIYVK